MWELLNKLKDSLKVIVFLFFSKMRKILQGSNSELSEETFGLLCPHKMYLYWWKAQTQSTWWYLE